MTPAPASAGYIDHPSLGRVRYQVVPLSPDPDEQVAQTIALMTEYAVEDSQSPLIKGEALSTATTGDPIEDCWQWLSRKDGVRGMRFIHDEDTTRPWGDIGRWDPVEALIRPVDQARLNPPQGDCDDFSMYGAAYLLARGVPCAFVTVAADGQNPDLYSHVYLAAYPQTGPQTGRRIPLDLSHGPHAGWETENRFGKRREWPIRQEDSLLTIAVVGIAGIVVWLLARMGGA